MPDLIDHFDSHRIPSSISNLSCGPSPKSNPYSKTYTDSISFSKGKMSHDFYVGDKSRFKKENQVGRTKDGLVFGVSCMQGWRPEMEDAHAAFIDEAPLDSWSFFAVFDGHGGDFAAKT